MDIKRILNNIPGTPIRFDDQTASEFVQYLDNKQKETKMAIDKVTHGDVTDFVKLLVEIGGVHKVLDDHTIVLKRTSEPIVIEDTDGTTAMLKVYHDNRIADNCLILNPFKEKSLQTPAQVWFEQMSMERKMRAMLVIVLEEIATAVLEKEEDTLFKLQKIMNFGDVMPPKNFKEELRKIDKDDILWLQYDKKSKRASLCSNLANPTVQESYKTRVKPKSWQFITDVFEAIFNISPSQMPEVFTYTSITHRAPQCEAIIKVAYDYFEFLNPVCEIVGVGTIDMAAWKEHNRYIEKYQQLVHLDDGLRQKPMKAVEVPWSNTTQQVATGPQQVVAQPSVQQPTAPTPVIPSQVTEPTSPTGYPKPADIAAKNAEMMKAPLMMMANGMMNGMMPGMMPQNMPGMMPGMMANGMPMPMPNQQQYVMLPNGQMVPQQNNMAVMPNGMPMMNGMMPGMVPGMMPGMMQPQMMPNGMPAPMNGMNNGYMTPQMYQMMVAMNGGKPIPGFNQYAMTSTPAAI